MYISKPKKYILQYTIQELKELSKQKYIRYRGRLLYIDHLIDLLHPFYEKVIRHGFSDEENLDFLLSRFCSTARLNSNILKKKYGRYYINYLDYLIEKGILRLKRNYHTSKRSKTYELILSFSIADQLVIHKNYDSSKHKRLLKYYNNELNLTPSSVTIDETVLRHTIDNLHHITIDREKSVAMLKSVIPDTKSNKYYRNNYCIQTISDRQIYLVPDEYGRIHTNFTVLKKEIRNRCLEIEDETIYERDVRNSQPFFLLKLMADNPEYFGKRREDLERYYELVSTGFFYEEVNKIFPEKTREEIKRWIMMVFFNRNYFHDKGFQEAFPSIYRFIKNFKKKHGYKSLAHRLQNIESEFIFNKVCRLLVEQKIKYFTVHDSIYVKESEKVNLNETFDQEFQNYLHDVEVKLFSENNI